MKNKRKKTDGQPLPARDSILPAVNPSPLQCKVQDKTSDLVQALEKMGHPNAAMIKAMAAAGRFSFLS